jgi:hypothetical protein
MLSMIRVYRYINYKFGIIMDSKSNYVISSEIVYRLDRIIDSKLNKHKTYKFVTMIQ